jgi:hypothetical protein
VLGARELPFDHVLDVGAERGVAAQDELAQRYRQRKVLPGEHGQLRPPWCGAGYREGPYPGWSGSAEVIRCVMYASGLIFGRAE